MSTNKTPLNLWLWQNGVDSSIGYRLASEDLIAVLDSAPPLQEVLGKFSGAEVAGTIQKMGAMKALFEFYKTQKDAGAPQKACQEDVVRKLQTGEIVAFGFEPPRRANSAPVHIPPHCLPYPIKLDGKPFQKGSMIFEDVRLLHRSKAEQLVRAWKAAQAPTAPTPKLPGPEGVQRRIEAAYAAMKAAGEISHTASMSAHFPALRLRLIAAHPDAGYGATRPTDETLRKTFRDLFRHAAGA